MSECDIGMKRLRVADLAEWSVRDVELWLRASGYESYVELFCDCHKIDGRALLSMRERDLRQPPLSLNCLGDIKRLTYGLKLLRRRYLTYRTECATSKSQEAQLKTVPVLKDVRDVTINLDDSLNETIVLDTDSLEISMKNRAVGPRSNLPNNFQASTQRTGSTIASITSSILDPSSHTHDPSSSVDNSAPIPNNDISKDLFPTLSNSPAQIPPVKPVPKASLVDSLVSSDSSLDLSEMEGGIGTEVPLAPHVQRIKVASPNDTSIQPNRPPGSIDLYPSLLLAGSCLPNQVNPVRYRGSASSRKHHQASSAKPFVPNTGSNHASGASHGWADDPAVILKAVLALAYTLVAFLTTAFVMVVVDDRVPDITRYPPLPDIFLDNIPLIPGAFVICEQMAIVLGTMFGFVCLLHKYRFIILRRFCALTGTVFFLRCITMVITSLSVPGSHLNCHNGQGVTPISVKVTRALRIWSGFGMSLVGIHTCGDYMFSGHTVIITMLNFFITEYTPRSFYLLHTFSWVLNLFGIFFILAAHEHYSIDVFIAFYITTRLFLYYHSLANNRALKQGDRHRMRTWFPMFSFFESHIEGIVPNVYGLPFCLINLCSKIAPLKPFLPPHSNSSTTNANSRFKKMAGARTRNHFSDGERSDS